ncbi:TonB-dependent receptor domain-containing protein [Phenylobacterium sp.]|jgi:outer membrane receptor protein involved in Fe transport|uniref:TonB-dependent receptor domain-containing protein n=1 Tax=Phenylobacterium sp. TaxID=1871053 RepID=UPI002F40BCE6
MTGHTTPARRRAALLGGLALAALTAALTAAPFAARAQAAHPIHIAAGSLDAALQALAAQSHEQLLYASGVVAGRKAPALDGDFTTEQALQRLLANSDITIRQTAPAVFVLKRAPASVAPISTAPAEGQGRAAAGRPFGADPAPTPAPGPLAVAAAPTAGPKPTGAAATVSEVEVTGSHIRGVGVGASPLTVIDRAAFDRLGQLTLAEGLSVLPQNFNGQDTEISAITFSDNRGVNSAFGTGVNLRGLGSDATLVLVNGRRPGGAGAKGDFTDISTLPNIAVQRTEILLDGASAIYGSDAVGGVVNIIMRRDFDGVEARLEGGQGAGGTPDEGQFGLIGGRQWASGGVVLAYEAYHRTALQAADRDFTASADLRPLGGSDFRTAFSHPGNILAVNAAGALVPFFAIPPGQDGRGLTAASFTPNTVNLGNPHEGESILPDQERQSLYLAAHQDLGARVELSGEAIYGFRAARLLQTPPTATFSVTPADPFFVSPNGATSESIEYKFSGDLPPPVNRSTAETLALTAGAKVGLWGDWRSDSFLDFSQQIEEGHTTGAVNTTILAEALGNVPDRPTTAFSPARDGFFNPFTGEVANTPAVLAAIGSGFVVTRRVDRVYTASTQADGTLLQLPGGALKLAVGGQVRHETFLRDGSNYTSTVAPTPQQGTDVSRTVDALFAELNAPLFGPDNARPGLQRLELSAAARWEHYNDFGSTWNPKLGALWTPIDDLNVRATYGRSFRAPGLRELDDPAANSPIHIGAGANTTLVLLLTGGNPNLRPETADTWTAGMDWQPRTIDGLRLSATWFDVAYQNRIDTPVTSFLSTALTDPTFSAFIRRLNTANPTDLAAITALLASPQTLSAGSFPASAFGAIVDGRFVNTGALRVQGLDLTGTYGFGLADGRLTLGLNASDLLRYDQALTPTAASVDRVGQVNFPARLRGRLTADWSRGPVTLGAALNATSSFHDTLGVHVAALTTTDLQLRWTSPAAGRWAGLSLALNARNIFDTAPPFYNNPLGYAFDPGNADVIGRFVSVQLTKSW